MTETDKTFPTKTRIVIDGKSYRMRRGKLVEIPPEWVGRDTNRCTIRKRKSKLIHKLRRGKPKPMKKLGIQM